MKTITMYELLGLVKDGKAPKKIKYKGTIWYLEQDFSNRLPYYKNGYNMDNLLTGKEKDYFSHSLNDEVEILEEDKEIPEKIDIMIDDTNTEYIKGKSYGKNYSKSAIELAHTINEIIDYLDYLKNKGE